MPRGTKTRNSVLGTLGRSALAIWLATAGCSFDADNLRPKHKDASVLVEDVGRDVAVADTGADVVAADTRRSEEADMIRDAGPTPDLALPSDPAGDRSGPPNDAESPADRHDFDAAEDGGPSQDDASYLEAGSGLEVGGTEGADTPLGEAGGSPLVEAGTDSRPDLGPDSAPDARSDGGIDSVDAIRLPSGLVAYYPCESATGVLLPDQSGNGNDATLSSDLPANGGPSAAGSGYRFEAGKVGNALTLLKNGYGYVTMPPSIFNGAAALTVAFWIKVNTAQNWPHAFDFGINAHLTSAPYTGASYVFLTPQNATSQLELAITANGYKDAQLLYANPIVAADGWRHIAVILDGSQGVVYVSAPGTSGTRTTSSTLTLRPVDLGTLDYAYLGKSPWSVDPYFDGQLDEVRIYRRALSAAEVQTLAQFTGP